jgi:agmatinase
MSKEQVRFDSMYGNNFGFLGLPVSRDLTDADAVVLGIPYDMATTGRSGSRQGPQGVRSASVNLRWEYKRWPWKFDAFERINVVDYGDVDFLTGESESMIAAVVETADHILSQGKTLLSFGGDHFVTLPLLRAHAKHHGTMALVHFDAHTDTEEGNPSRYNHGAMFHFAPIEGLIDPSKSVQVGIRTEYDESKHPFSVLDARWVNDHSAEDAIAHIKARVGDAPVYLTFDIDCLDPAYAPGTGTPVVGGLTSDRALAIVRGLADLNIVGMDVVEVAPCYDHAEVTSLAAATIGLDLLYMLAHRKGG